MGDLTRKEAGERAVVVETKLAVSMYAGLKMITRMTAIG
jgi:hypothetical protein